MTSDCAETMQSLGFISKLHSHSGVRSMTLLIDERFVDCSDCKIAQALRNTLTTG